jgi:hypothetical protein
MPKAYLDNCLVSGLANRDLKTDEQQALRRLLQLQKEGRVALVTSHITRLEIERMPGPARGLHEDVYALLADVPAATENFGHHMLLLGVGGGDAPEYAQLKKLLPDEDDARHLFQAIKNEVDYFVTADVRTIVSRAQAVELEFDIKVRTPSQVVAELST